MQLTQVEAFIRQKCKNSFLLSLQMAAVSKADYFFLKVELFAELYQSQTKWKQNVLYIRISSAKHCPSALG